MELRCQWRVNQDGRRTRGHVCSSNTAAVAGIAAGSLPVSAHDPFNLMEDALLSKRQSDEWTVMEDRLTADIRGADRVTSSSAGRRVSRQVVEVGDKAGSRIKPPSVGDATHVKGGKPLRNGVN